MGRTSAPVLLQSLYDQLIRHQEAESQQYTLQHSTVLGPAQDAAPFSNSCLHLLREAVRRWHEQQHCSLTMGIEQAAITDCKTAGRADKLASNVRFPSTHSLQSTGPTCKTSRRHSWTLPSPLTIICPSSASYGYETNSQCHVFVTHAADSQAVSSGPSWHSSSINSKR